MSRFDRTETTKDISDRYNDWLDEMGNEKVLNNYLTSQTLEKIDPIAYYVGLQDFENMIEELEGAN